MNNSPKKILYCENNVDGTIGGSYYSLLYLVSGLDRKKYQPLVVFYDDNALLPRFRHLGVETLVFRRSTPFHLGTSLQSFPKNLLVLGPLLRLTQKAVNLSKLLLTTFRYAFFLKRNKIAVVHLNNSISVNHDWMLAGHLANVPCVTHERAIRSTYQPLARFLSKRLATVICVSEAVRANLIEKGVDRDNLVVIWNGLDPKAVSVERPASDIALEYGLVGKTPVVGIVGNIREWKGQEIVIEAISAVKERFPSIVCLIVGATSSEDHAYWDRLNQLVDQLQLSENVVFTGYQANVADLISIMQIVIHASIEPEPFGRVLLEAMALLKPLIGTNGGAVSEIIEEGETGLIVPPGRSKELSHAIVALLERPDVMRSMGEKGFRRLVERFHIRRNVEGTENVYASLIPRTTNPDGVPFAVEGGWLRAFRD